MVQSWFILTLSTLLLILFRLVVAEFRLPQFATADNPAAKSPSWLTRTLTFLYLPVFHSLLLIWPQWLSFDWSMEAISLITSISDRRNLATLIFYGGLLAGIHRAYRNSVRKCRLRFNSPSVIFRSVQPKSCCHYRSCMDCNSRYRTEYSSASKKMVDHRGQLVLLIISLIVIPFLPATNLFFYVGFVIAERILYLPSVGYCLLVGLGYQEIRKKMVRRRKSINFSISWVGFVSVALLVATLTIRTLIRNRDWNNEERLYRSGILINPPKAYGNLGLALKSQGRYAEAEWSLKMALSYRPNMAEVHFNLGNLFQQQSRLEEAVQAFNRAIAFRPQMAAAYLEKAKVLSTLQRHKEAEEVLRNCLTLSEDSVRDLVTHRSVKKSALIQLAQIYNRQGKHQEAAALLGNSVYSPTWQSYSKDFGRQKAEDWLLRAQKLQPDNPLIYQYLGHFLLNRLQYDEAADQLVKAAEMDPLNIAMTVAAAHALRDACRNPEAEIYFRRAVALNPKDISNYVNLGAILHLQGKLQEAEEIYRDALRLHPHHSLAAINLQRLRTSWLKKSPLNQSWQTAVSITCKPSCHYHG